MTGRDVRRRVSEALRATSGAVADVEARWLLEAVTGKGKTAQGDSIDDSIVAELDDMVRRRAAGEPLQYITGVAGFRRLELNVGPGVFIPRPETEIVAEHAMTLVPRGGNVVDIGTGTGAIALSIADERPDAKVFATERSPRALAWARRNIESSGLPVTLVEGDLFDGLPDELTGAVDVVVSNPPYVARSEQASLPADVVDHEPHDALFAGEDGLATIRRLVEAAAMWLRMGGSLVLEIGETQGDAVQDVVRSALFEDVGVHPDLTGRSRVVVGRRPRGL